MDRVFVYDGQVPLTKDHLDQVQYDHIAHAALLEALRGSQNGGVYGLAIKATPSPSLQVVMERGVLAAPLALNDTAYSSLPADTSKTLLKYAISHADFTIGTPATLPTGSNRYIGIIQAELQENDIENTILPYYNESDPATAHLGPNDSGVAQPRRRVMAISTTWKYGVATTGTPVAPTPDAGHIALCQVELRSTTTQISLAADSSTNAQIVAYEGAAGTPRLNNFAQLDAALNLFEGDVSMVGDLVCRDALMTDLQCNGTMVGLSTISAAGDIVSLGTVAGSAATAANHLTQLGQFAANSASDGHFTIPVEVGNDILVQWVSVTTGGAQAYQAGSYTFTWNTPFPNAIYAAVATVHQNSNAITGEDDNNAWLDVSTIGGTAYSRENRNVRIIAIGN